MAVHHHGRGVADEEEVDACLIHLRRGDAFVFAVRSRRARCRGRAPPRRGSTADGSVSISMPASAPSSALERARARGDLQGSDGAHAHSSEGAHVHRGWVAVTIESDHSCF